MTVYRSQVVAADFHADTRAWFAGKRVVVTGGGGFIGSHVVEQLLELGRGRWCPPGADIPLS